jgi:trigger factor
MQISVQQTTPLGRRMTIAVPADRVEQEIKQRLDSLAKTAKISGFRPGKIPMSVVVKRYGGKVRQEVVDELLNATFYEAVVKEKLRPAGAPTIESRRDAPGEALEYTAVFEVYPEVEIKSLEGLSVEKPVAQISDKDVDAMIERMRRQQPDYVEVDRAAQDADQVIVDLGRDDGQPGAGHQIPVVIGAKGVMEGFEEALIGLRVGEEKTIELTFPENYRDPQMAGKPVGFHVKVIKISEPKLPPVDEAFAGRFGIETGGVEALRKEVLEGMRREAEEAAGEVAKGRLLEQLRQRKAVDLPRTLVDEEVKRMASEKSGGPAAAGSAPDIQAEAEARVAIGILISEIIRQQGLQVKPDILRAKVESIATSYDEPAKVVEWYYADRRRLRQVETTVLEQQALDWLLERANVREQPLNYDELMVKRRGD